MTYKIIALCGPKQSGKSTLQQLLIETNPACVPLNFADPIKEMLCAFLDAQGVEDITSYEMLWGASREEPSEYFEGRSARWAMQSLGTEWGRRLIGPDLWINSWERQVKRQVESVICIAADLRFLNEAAIVRKLGGCIIRIERVGCEPSLHVSEREFLKVKPDLVIINNSDPQDMLEQLQFLIKE